VREAIGKKPARGKLTVLQRHPLRGIRAESIGGAASAVRAAGSALSVCRLAGEAYRP
jgi:hypothetical protein